MSARRLALGSLLQVANLIGAALASFLLTPYVVKSVGDAAYGMWIIVGALIGYYGLLDFGLSATVARFLAKAVGAGDTKDLQDTYSTAVVVYTGIACVALAVTAILLIVVPASSATSAPVFRRVVAMTGIAFALGFPLRAFAGLAQAFLRYDIPAWLELFGIIVRSLIVVVLIRSGWSIDGLALASLVAVMMQLVLWPPVSGRLKSGVTLSPRHATRLIGRRLMNFSAFVFIRQLADLLRFRVDVLIVGQFVGLAAVTHYGIATLLTGYFMGLVTSAMSVLTGLFSRHAGANDSAALQKAFMLGTRISVFMASFIGFGLLAWGHAFIARWMGSAYTDAYPILVILTIGCVLALWQSPSVSAMYAVNRHRFLAVVTIAEAVINVALSILLVQRYGMIGVALGTTIPLVAVKLSLQPLYVCRVLGIPPRVYAGILVTAALKSAAALIPAFVLSYTILQPNFLSLALVGGIAATCYVIGLWLWAFDGGERQLLRGIVSSAPAAA